MQGSRSVLFSMILLTSSLGTAWAPLVANAAQLLDPPAVYARCHAHITGQQVKPQDAVTKQILSGSTTAEKACVALLDRAGFGGDSRLKDPGDAIAVAALKTMNNFHRTWFSYRDFITGTDTGECYPFTALVYDVTEPALHVTRSLFAPSASFSDIVRSAGSVEAIRERAANFNPIHTTNADGSVVRWPASLPYVQDGTLLGVRAGLPSAPSPYGNEDIRANEGGGILGSRSFLLASFGRSAFQTSDGGTNVPRRWAKAVLSDLLCRDLPALRPADAAPHVQAGSKLPFRTGPTCVQCHASMDPLSFLARGLYPHRVGQCGAAGSANFLLKHTAIDQPSEAGPVDADPLFFRRPPKGHLRYRSYDGKLVDLDVTSFQALGQALAESDDLYACAAKRYYQFFTGIDVSLADLGSPNAPTLSEADIKHREIVISLGKKLKQDQSLKNLVFRIVGSETYRRPTLGKDATK